MKQLDRIVSSAKELDARIASAKPNPSTWAADFSTVASFPLPPHRSIRDDRVLLVDPESGYWEVVPLSEADVKESTLRERAERLGSSPPSPSTYDSDLYPLECVLYLTNKCNMACSYCYSTVHREADWRDFDLTLIKKAIRMLFREKRRQSLSFLLFGGESLAAFELLKHVVEYAETLNLFFNKNLTFRMQTNGSLLTDDIARYLAAHNIAVGVSLDGPEDVHNRARKNHAGRGTYNEVMRGIGVLREHGVPFSVIATVSDPDDMLPVFQYFATEPITSRVKISPLLPEGAARNHEAGGFLEYAKRWGRQNLLGAEELIRHNRGTAHRVREGNLFAMITHLLTPLRPDICLRTPCGAGYGMVEFHPNGDVVTCDKTLYSEELGIVASLADLRESDSLLELLDDSPLVARIRSRTVDSIPKCSHCPVKRHCGGSCTLGSYDFFKSFNREDVMCEYRRYMFEELMWLMVADPMNVLRLAAPEKAL